MFFPHSLSKDNGVSANDAAPSTDCPAPAVPPRSRRASVTSPSESTDPTSCLGSAPSATESADANPDAGRVSRPHRLLRVSVSYPRLCSLCQDYIVSPRCAAHQCSHCRMLLHATCARQAVRSQRIFCPRSATGVAAGMHAAGDPIPLSDSACSISDQPLTLWTELQVAHWLTVVGLSRFVMLFLRKKVDGSVLRQLVPHSSHLDQVVDPFARQALRRAILVLSGMQPGAGEDTMIEPSDPLPSPAIVSRSDEEVAAQPISDGAPAKTEHDFKICSFTQEVACVVCGLPLLGLLRQGFQCHTCGMIFHRVCKVLDSVPACPQTPPAPPLFAPSEGDATETEAEVQDTLDYTRLPRRLVPYRGDYFMVPLEDQPLDPSSQIPLFLLTCTNLIERMATESLTAAATNPAAQPVNLVAAYQQSASARTLAELRRTYAHRLPSLEPDPSSSEPLDVVRLAQLVKAFLRDLPHAVIWEERYREFCALAALDDTADHTKAVREFLTSLPQPHRVCLTHVMKHLDFVWTHQRKLRDHLDSSATPVAQAGCLDNRALASGTSTGQQWRRANQQLTRPDNWLLVFRQILVRPPWHLITHIATALDVHLQSLKVLFYALASPPPCPPPAMTVTPVSGNGRASPVVLRPRLPPKLSGGRISPSPALATLRQSTTNTEYGVVNMPSPRVSGDSPPGPTVDTPPSPQSVAENKRDLCTREWYWGDVTQAEVREIMDGLADGYFLVRDASARSAGSFTLVVRWHGENKLNRIYHRGDYFGVIDPPAPVFRLVSDLIDYYRAHTPKPGEHMGMQLLWPISHRHYRYRRSGNSQSPVNRSSAPASPTGPPAPVFGDETVERSSLHDSGVFACNLPKQQLFAELFETGAKLVDCETRLKQLMESVGAAIAANEEAAKLIGGHQKLKDWLTVQLQRLDEYAVPQENAQLVHQRKMISERIREVERQIKINTDQHTLQSSLSRILYEQQVGMMLQQRKLRRQAQEIRRALKNLGVHEDSILDRYSAGVRPSADLPESLPEDLPQFSSLPRAPRTPRSRSPDSFVASSSGTSPTFRQRSSSSVNPPTLSSIGRRSAWFVQTITREQVEELLASKPPGTFLIRPSTDGRRLALGVRLASSIQHCLIHHVNGKYGFVKSSCSFDSLEDLVRYYHVNSLKQHNPMLTTTLRYPVNST